MILEPNDGVVSRDLPANAPLKVWKFCEANAAFYIKLQKIMHN